MPKKVLLVDDAAMFLEIQKDFLKLSTLSVVCAKDGLEALEKVKTLLPDLLVMDLHMPRMNGAECCAAIKADPELCSIPVIMTTSAGKEDDHELCRKAGCDGLLTKPIERGLFLDAVRRFIPELDRREVRISFTAKVRFQAFRVNMSGTIMDLSARGIYIATDFDLEVGTEVVLAFPVSAEDGSLVQAKGVVRWQNSGSARTKENYPPGFGLELTALTGESRSILQRYLAKRGV
ncbi:MAG: response regulator [Geobacteraceae bacterium]|nr:response regulator [Geobacteraceae bacterium]